MVVTVWWAPEGERHGALESYSTYSEPGEHEVTQVAWGCWSSKGVYGLAVQTHEPHKIYTGEEDEYGNEEFTWSDTRLIDDYWSIDTFLAPYAAASLEEYMTWADANIDIVAVDGSVFFRSSRLDK